MILFMEQKYKVYWKIMGLWKVRCGIGNHIIGSVCLGMESALCPVCPDGSTSLCSFPLWSEQLPPSQATTTVKLCQWVQELSLSQVSMAELSETISKIILFSFEVVLLRMFVTVREKQLRWWLRDMASFIQHPGPKPSALYHQSSWY